MAVQGEVVAVVWLMVPSLLLLLLLQLYNNTRYYACCTHSYNDELIVVLFVDYLRSRFHTNHGINPPTRIQQ